MPIANPNPAARLQSPASCSPVIAVADGGVESGQFVGPLDDAKGYGADQASLARRIEHNAFLQAIVGSLRVQLTASSPNSSDALSAPSDTWRRAATEPSDNAATTMKYDDYDQRRFDERCDRTPGRAKRHEVKGKARQHDKACSDRVERERERLEQQNKRQDADGDDRILDRFRLSDGHPRRGLIAGLS